MGTSWPSPNHGSPPRSVTEAEYQHLIPFAADGIFGAATDLVYANGSGLQTHVRANRYALVRGHAWSSGAAEETLAHDPNTSGQTRVDTVVVRLDRGTWDVGAAVRKGTPGAGPPALVHDDGDSGVFEIPAADVTVTNGAVSLSGDKVRNRPLLQAGGARACDKITDIQAYLTPGDIVWETSTGRWIGWTAAGGLVLYEDTGWNTVATDTDYWTPGAFALAIRRRNGTVHLRGSVERHLNKLAASDTYSHILTIPSGYRPAASHLYAAWVGGGDMCLIRLYPTGDLATTGHMLDGISVNHNVYLDTTYPVG